MPLGWEHGMCVPTADRSGLTGDCTVHVRNVKRTWYDSPGSGFGAVPGDPCGSVGSELVGVRPYLSIRFAELARCSIVYFRTLPYLQITDRINRTVYLQLKYGYTYTVTYLLITTYSTRVYGPTLCVAHTLTGQQHVRFAGLAPPMRQ